MEPRHFIEAQGGVHGFDDLLGRTSKVAVVDNAGFSDCWVFVRDTPELNGRDGMGSDKGEGVALSFTPGSRAI